MAVRGIIGRATMRLVTIVRKYSNGPGARDALTNSQRVAQVCANAPRGLIFLLARDANRNNEVPN